MSLYEGPDNRRFNFRLRIDSADSCRRRGCLSVMDARVPSQSLRPKTRARRSEGLGLELLAGAALLVTVLALGGPSSAAADLEVNDADVALGVRSPTQGNTVSLSATVHNLGDTAAANFTVRFTLDGSSTLANVVVASLAAGASANVTASWTVPGTMTGTHTLNGVADATAQVAESDELNNQGDRSFDVNEPPLALASVNVSAQDSLVPFYFDAGASADPDGTIQSYVWIFDDGTTATGATANHSFGNGGAGAGKVYRVTVLVTDDDGGTDAAQIDVNVYNRGPVALTGDVIGLTKTALAFDGTASTDLDGRIVNATWAFSDGRTLYGLTVLRSFDDNGAYTATLTITDDDGASNSIGLNVSISNQAPNVVITTTPAMPFTANLSAFFDGRASFDVDGGITNYTWVFPGGQTAQGWNATYTFAQNGTYNVTLVLVDDDGALSELTIAALVGQDATGTNVPTPPVARIGFSASTVFTAEVVVLDAVNSSDDTGIISYLWDFGDGSVGVGLVATHTWANDGNFIVTLNVTDTDGNSSFAQQTIRVKNRLPVASGVASPGEDLTLKTFSFDASSSADPDGTLLYYRWAFGDGSVLYGRTVQHIYTRAGTYLVTLTVTDNDGGEGATSLSVTVHNRAPVAVTPANFSVPTFEDRVFDAVLSFDPDGLIQSYTWTFGDGTNATGRAVKHAFATQGAKTVSLTVRDDSGATGTASFTVTVTNNGPTAVITGPLSVYTNEPANFAGDGLDRDGTITVWDWNFGDLSANASSVGLAAHAYPTKGTYTVTLRVVDNSGAAGTASFTVRVLNRLPTARIASPSSGATAQSLTPIAFSAEGSSDPETAASGLAYFWIFGDGQVASGLSVSHPFQRAGAFTVILTVSDGEGGAASATVPVVIQNRVPVPEISASPPSADSLVDIAFDGSGSADQDGTVTSYLWEFGDGATSNLRSPTHAFAASAVAGAYTVRLTVFDNLGANGSTTLAVTINNRLPVAAFTFGDPVYGDLSTVFHGTSSTDADGTIVSFAWEFGDGATATGSEAAHKFPATEAPTTYTVKLTVTDSRGGVSAASHDVTVVKKPVFDTGKPGEGGTTPVQSPGFEGVFVAVALAGVALAAARRRRA